MEGCAWCTRTGAHVILTMCLLGSACGWGGVGCMHKCMAMRSSAPDCGGTRVHDGMHANASNAGH